MRKQAKRPAVALAHYFENREALLAAVAEHAVKNYRKRLSEQNLPAADGIDSLLAAIAFYLDDSRGWPKKLHAFYEVMNAGLRWPAIGEVIARLNQEWIDRIAAQIRTAQRKATSAPTSTRSPKPLPSPARCAGSCRNG